ncbi:hypothetical protein [Streptomyces sp. MAI_2237]
MRHGLDDVTLLEAAAEPGGTWFHNRYPGAPPATCRATCTRTPSPNAPPGTTCSPAGTRSCGTCGRPRTRSASPRGS